MSAVFERQRPAEMILYAPQLTREEPGRGFMIEMIPVGEDWTGPTWVRTEDCKGLVADVVALMSVVPAPN